MSCLGRVFLVVLLSVLWTGRAVAEEAENPAASQMPSVIVAPPQARPAANFNIETATNAYLDEITQADRARSDAYLRVGTG
jgi:hypothetical protein